MKYKLLFGLMILCLSACDKNKEIVVTSNNKLEWLTIISVGSKYHIYNGLVNGINDPARGYLINEGVVEHFSALAQWRDDVVNIYYTYGVYNDSKSNGEFNLKRISVKEFEALKGDTSYTYFYY